MLHVHLNDHLVVSPRCIVQLLLFFLPQLSFHKNPSFLHGRFVQTGLFAVFPVPKPEFRGKQNLLHEGKIGFSVFSIHVWSSHFPASPPLIAVELHFMEKWNFLILSWIFHLPCVGELAEPVFWISSAVAQCCRSIALSIGKTEPVPGRRWKN